MKPLIIVSFLLSVACAGSAKRAEPVFSKGTAVLFGLPQGAVPENDLITGGQPTAVTMLGAARAGVKSIVNLRGEGESPHPGVVRGWAQKTGIAFYHLPIEGPEAITRENAEKLAALLEEAEKPILLHCGSSNRVGALLALRAFYIDGLPAEEAVRFGRAAGLTRLEKIVRRRLAEGRLEKAK